MLFQDVQKEGFTEEIKRHKSDKNYDALLLTAQRAVQTFPNEQSFWNALHYAQSHYVEKKLESQIVKQLEGKGDYLSLMAVYQKLLTIFPESKKLHKLLKKLRVKIQEAHKTEVKNFYSQAKKQIEELIQKGEYENAKTACWEILEDEPENKDFVQLLLKASQALDHKMDAELELYFKTTFSNNQREYQEHQDQFIRI